MRRVRGHWCVENGLHFIKDRWWDEDRQWSTRPGLAERLAMLRDAALTALHVLPGVPEDLPIRGRADHLAQAPQGAEVHRSPQIGTLQSSCRARAGGRQRDGGLVPQRDGTAADPLGPGTRPGRAAGAEGLLLNAPEDEAATIPVEVVKRWPIEVTFEESRDHLGVETQRQWSDRAIERETPCLLGLYSVVADAGRCPPRGVADHDPVGDLVSEGGSDVRGCAGCGPARMLGFPGYSDIRPATRPVQKSRGCNSIACSTRYAMPIDPYKVELVHPG